ncbi:MAG: hypothetical protein AAF564_08355 [Bacteroidota bacterium]
MSISESSTQQEFINNPNCSVSVDERGDLLCATSGRFVTIVLFVVGMLFIYASIVIIGWELPSGRIHSSTLLSGTFVFLLGILCQWRSYRRQKEMGNFEISVSAQVIRKQGKQTGYPFDYITRLRITRNWTAMARIQHILPIPVWLFIHFKNGHRIRVATGRRDEVMELLKWMRAADIPCVDWV